MFHSDVFCERTISHRNETGRFRKSSKIRETSQSFQQRVRKPEAESADDSPLNMFQQQKLLICSLPTTSPSSPFGDIPRLRSSVKTGKRISTHLSQHGIPGATCQTSGPCRGWWGEPRSHQTNTLWPRLHGGVLEAPSPWKKKVSGCSVRVSLWVNLQLGFSRLKLFKTSEEKASGQPRFSSKLQSRILLPPV